MKLRTRRWRNRNSSYLRKRAQKSKQGEKQPELKENASGVDINPSDQGNCSTREENAAASVHEPKQANEEPNQVNEEPNHENHANENVQAAPATDDEDSGTENDRNEIGILTDDEYESEKESYKVEVSRTLKDIVHTRDMLFSLTTRVDQLLEICKILQTRQNQQKEQAEQRQQEQEPPNAGAGKFSQ